MSQLVKTKRQGNFKDFKRFGAFKGLVEQKTLYSICSCVNWAFFGTSGPLKRSFHSRFKLAHSCQKSPNLAFVRFYLMYLLQSPAILVRAQNRINQKAKSAKSPLISVSHYYSVEYYERLNDPGHSILVRKSYNFARYRKFIV
jgi:hypothetical protein